MFRLNIKHKRAHARGAVSHKSRKRINRPTDDRRLTINYYYYKRRFRGTSGRHSFCRITLYIIRRQTTISTDIHNIIYYTTIAADEILRVYLGIIVFIQFIRQNVKI